MIPSESSPRKPRVTQSLRGLDCELQCEDRSVIAYVLEECAMQLAVAKDERYKREIMSKIRLTGWYLRRAIDAEAQS